MASRGGACFLILALALAACADAPENLEASGAVAIPLLTVGVDGNTYSLEDAVFRFTSTWGGTPIEVDADGEVVEQALLPGEYQLELLPGWHMTQDGQEVDVTLVSRNPQLVEVRTGVTTDVHYEFVLGSDEGGAHITIGVDGSYLVSLRLEVTQGFAQEGSSGVFSAFAPGQVIHANLRFPASGAIYHPPFPGNSTQLILDPLAITFFGGPPVLEELVAPAFTGTLLATSLVHEQNEPLSQFSGLEGVGESLDGWNFSFFIASHDVAAALDGRGLPSFSGLHVDTTWSLSRRVLAEEGFYQVTDSVQGIASLDFGPMP